MSTNRRIYLDFNATAPLSDAARAAMAEAMAEVGNPSSVHGEGRRARDRVERARSQVAALAGPPREQVVFTSGGTEANVLGVLALAKVAEQRGLRRVVATTAIEHPSLRGAIAALRERGWGVVEHVDDGVGLVAIGLVNHELGTIAEVVRTGNALVHIDAVQAAGKLPLDALDADSIAISAHKLGGPQGVGVLAIADDEGLPIIDGGHQERGRRPGTENVLGIVGFGAAAAAANVGDWPRVAALGARLEARAAADRGRPHPRRGTRRVGGTINAGFSGRARRDDRDGARSRRDRGRDRRGVHQRQRPAVAGVARARDDSGASARGGAILARPGDDRRRDRRGPRAAARDRGARAGAPWCAADNSYTVPGQAVVKAL